MKDNQTATKVCEVLSTRDYSIFRKIRGNRVVNDIHVERLKKSFKTSYLISPIIVNEKHEIIDGQHRFNAAISMGLPINYIIVEGYGLEQVKALNTNTNNWKNKDYLNAYCDLGYEPYLQMRKFMEDYPDFGIAAADVILANTPAGSGKKSAQNVVSVNGKRRGGSRDFAEGNFHIPNIEESYANADKIMMLKPYYEGFNRRVFVSAMIGIFQIEDYSHLKMLQKLQLNPGALVHCTTSGQYKLMLEDIYNYRNRNKISLRF